MNDRNMPAVRRIAMVMLSCLNSLLAGQFGDLTYIESGTAITITDCAEGAAGSLQIPSAIAGKPVTAIGNDAFENCSSLTGVTIPASVTSIGSFAFNSCVSLTEVVLPNSVASIGNSSFQACTSLASVTIPSSVASIGSSAFYGCSGLSSILVNALNSHYSSGDGILFNKTQTILIQCPAAKTGSIAIPGGVITIGNQAFESCYNLTGVTIPNSVTTIGGSAFYGCTGLTSAIIPPSVVSIGAWAFQSCASLTSVFFTGDAPSLAPGVFDFAAETFTVYYFNGKAGFTSPTWMDYPAVNMGNTSPAAPWLMLHGLPSNADLLSDPNGDGVSLLMAYAFNLNPHQNLSGSLPRPEISTNQMTLIYYAGSVGVTYSVQSCTDLQSWSSSGVIVSAPDANKFRTASIAVSGPRRFMRIVVTY